MTPDLPSFLRSLPHSGEEGFEGLIAALLEQVTGQRFCLAKSGSQQGRDMRSGSVGGSVVAVECKHYLSTTSRQPTIYPGTKPEARTLVEPSPGSSSRRR